MASLDAAGRAVINPGFRENILKGIGNSETGNRKPGIGNSEFGIRKPGIGIGNSEFGYGTIKRSMIWKIAAVILLLISLNVFTMVYYSKSSGSGQSATKTVASEYFSYIDNYNL